MNAFDLAVEDAVRIDRDAVCALQPLCERCLGRALGGTPLAAKRAVIGERPEPAQLGEGAHPACAARATDRAGERWVRELQPATRSDAVGLVVEALGVHLGQIFDRL